MRLFNVKRQPVSQYSSPKFKKLQKKWYDKLAKSGFQEIEDTNSPREMLKQWHNNYFRNKNRQLTFKEKETYFKNATWFLHSHVFETSLEKRIWEAHSDGLSLSETATLLGCSKSRAFLVVKRLKEVMNK